MDAAAIKDAARGRELELLTSLAGIAPELLDGRHHACPRCGGVDRFRLLDRDAGAVLCSQCFAEDNGDWLAAVGHYRGWSFPEVCRQAAAVLGMANGGAAAAGADPLDLFCRQKRVPREAALAYGATTSGKAVTFPSWAPDGGKRSLFKVTPTGNDRQRKGLWPRGGSAGVFLPLVGDGPRLPQPGETWLVTEGVKDAAALHGLGLLALGMPTCHLAAPFARLLAGVDVILVPDRDKAGLDGAEKTARRLLGVAATVRIAHLPAELKPSGGADVRDVLAQRDGERLVREALEQAQPFTAAGGDRPTIMVGVDELRVTDEAIAALAKRDGLYQRGGQLVEVLEAADPPTGLIRPEGGLRSVAINKWRLRELLSDSAAFVKVDAEGEETECAVPQTAVEQTLSRGVWRGIPQLCGVVSSPQFLADGSVLATPGYDRRSGLYLAPDCTFPTIHERPTKGDAEAARDELLETICDFPLDEVGRAAWLAVVLTSAARYAINGPTPLFAFDANVRGSGKSLAADLVGVIATGRTLPRTTATANDDEFRKRITAILLAGEPLVLLDNLDGALGGPALDAVLTSITWTDRILGESTMTPAIHARAIWMSSGNNTQFHADTARRSLRLRLMSELENPEERTGFRHPNLLAWVRENRGRLAVAAVTILRAWHLAGRPGMGLSPWGSFDAWSDIVRAAVAWVGLADPGAGRQEVQREADREAGLLRMLLDAWERSDPAGHGLTTLEALRRAETGDVGLAAAFAELTGPGGRTSPKSIGRRLLAVRQRVSGGRYLDSRPSRAGQVWFIRQVDECGFEGFSGFISSHPTRENTTGTDDTHACARVHERAASKPAKPVKHAPCDHLDPATWVERDGAMHCPGCGRWMGTAVRDARPGRVDQRTI